METNLMDFYKADKGNKFLWTAICKSLGNDYFNLEREVLCGEKTIDIKLIVDGKEYSLQPFFDTLFDLTMANINMGIKEMAEQQAQPLLSMIDKLSLKLKEDIESIYPDYSRD